MCPLPTFLSYKANQSGSSLNPALSILAMRRLLWHHFMNLRSQHRYIIYIYIYTCSKRIHYSIPIPQATIPHYFQPSPSARERGCYRDLALKLYRNQPRKSTVPKSELLDFSQPSLLLIKAATKKSSCHPQGAWNLSQNVDMTRKWRAWALYLEYIGMHHPSSCTCTHSQMIPGFIRFPLLHLLQLVNVHEMPG